MGEKNHKGADYVFQEDGALAHMAKLVQEWLGLNMLFGLTWPPQSTDLTPLDYSVRVQIEGRACTTRHNNVDALKSSVNHTWTSMG